jgi:tRNA (guanosine-2'-O-)-methyltransferase
LQVILSPQKYDCMTRRKNLFDEIPVEEALENFSGRITPERLRRLESVLEKRSRFVVPVMEDLYQEQNAGAIIRTVECCGFQELGIIELNNKYKLAPGIAKGAQKWVDARIFDSSLPNALGAAIDHYRNKGYRLTGACPHNKGYRPDNLPLDRPVALFFGAEKMGLHPDIRAEMEDYVAIPMRGFTESYNVSVSAAIILQELRQRLERSEGPDYLLPADEHRALLLQWVIRSMPGGMEQLRLWKKTLPGREV